MSEKEVAGRCWVLRWRMAAEPSVLQDFLQVLPWRWNPEHLEEYLLSQYYNSPTTLLSDRTDWMNSKVRTGLVVIEEKKRVIVGDGPFLVANLVEDFSVTFDAKRNAETVSYTEPGGTRFDIEAAKVFRNSAPVKVTFELQRRSHL